MAIVAGNYKINLFGPDGKLIFYLNNVPVKFSVDNVFDIDLAKQKAAAAKESGMTEEQRKAMEKAKKENEKIKGINALLLQATRKRRTASRMTPSPPWSRPLRRIRLTM